MNIALCDDSPLLRRILEAMIYEFGATKNVRLQIRQFESGEDLLEQTVDNQIRFDLIFLDQHMKKLSGVETALRIREYDRTCHIVFCTGSEPHPQFKAASPLRILEKPVRMEDIHAVLDKARVENKGAVSK